MVGKYYTEIVPFKLYRCNGCAVEGTRTEIQDHAKYHCEPLKHLRDPKDKRTMFRHSKRCKYCKAFIPQKEGRYECACGRIN